MVSAHYGVCKSKKNRFIKNKEVSLNFQKIMRHMTVLNLIVH